jgi:hypothetical protein
VQFSTSYTLPFGKAHMIDWITNKEYWQPALDQHGAERTDGWVINATDIIPLTDYPPGTKLFLRAEPLHPGAQPTLLDVDGHRITALLTNAPRWHGPFLDARHRARGRCENRIKTLKNTGLGKLPFFDFAANQAWANIAALAFNLVSWIQLTALPDSHHAKAWDIKRWRYRVFSIAGKIITRARRNQLLLPESAPEKDLLKLLLENTGRLKQLRPAPAKPAPIPVQTTSPTAGSGTGATPRRTNGPNHTARKQKTTAEQPASPKQHASPTAMKNRG